MGTKKISGRASSTPVGLALGFLVSIGITLLGAALLAKLLEAEKIEQSGIGYGIMVLLILASFIGAAAAVNRVKRQKLVICMGSGVLFFLGLLSITALFFGGQYSGVGVTALLILCGAGLAAMLSLRQGRGGLHKKRVVFNR